MLLRVHHAQVTVPSDQEAAARQFYCRVLGLREVPKPPSLHDRGGFWLVAGDGPGEFSVHVAVEDGVDRLATKAHLAYQVVGLAEWRRRIESAGLKPLDSIPIPGLDRFEFRDPFGNRVELIEALG
jgi:catechol 2,3-dioxygenase-like lactoylglutathione lyase family enzyme